MTVRKVTGAEVVRALKTIGRRVPAKEVAWWLGTDSRAIATALRLPVNDGRVSCRYKKGIARYRFTRLTAKVEKA